MRLVYATIGRYARFRSSNTNVLTGKELTRKFVFGGDSIRTYTVTPETDLPIPEYLLVQMAMCFANEGAYVEVRFSHINKRSALCYGDDTLNGLLFGITPTSITFHRQDESSYGVMMGTALALSRVAVTITGVRCKDGWEEIIETTLASVLLEPDGRVDIAE